MGEFLSLIIGLSEGAGLNEKCGSLKYDVSLSLLPIAMDPSSLNTPMLLVSHRDCSNVVSGIHLVDGGLKEYLWLEGTDVVVVSGKWCRC